jgi:hypothetical protein
MAASCGSSVSMNSRRAPLPQRVHDQDRRELLDDRLVPAELKVTLGFTLDRE